MKISPEMAEQLYRENTKMLQRIRQLREDNAFLKRCLYLALSRTNYTLVVEDDCDDLPDEIEFDLDENISHDLIVKPKKKYTAW